MHPPATHCVPVEMPTPVRVSQQVEPVAQSSAPSHASRTSFAAHDLAHSCVLFALL